MSTTIHTIENQTCSDCNCINRNYSVFSHEERVTSAESNTNIYGGKTSRSAIFATPVSYDAFYDPFITIVPPYTNPNTFATDGLAPASTDLLVTPSDFPSAAVFQFTSFMTTDSNNYTAEHISSPVLISVQQPGAATTLPNVITDIPKPTIKNPADFMFGSWDIVLTAIFNKSSSNFLVLTNPNELVLGTPDLFQVVWPNEMSFQFSFVGPSTDPDPNTNAILYTYTSDPAESRSQAVDQNGVPFGPITVTPAISSGVFAVFDDPTGYITARQNFDTTFPSSPPVCLGVTGMTGDIASGKMCLIGIAVDGQVDAQRCGVGSSQPTLNNCLCITILNESSTIGAVGSRQNGIQLAALLNAGFRKSNLKGWQAFADPIYPYFRIVYPNNVLKYSIQFKKIFFDKNGMRLPCYDELQTYTQGAMSIFVKNDPTTGGPITTNNVMDLFNGLAWTANSDKNGCLAV